MCAFIDGVSGEGSLVWARGLRPSGRGPPPMLGAQVLGAHAGGAHSCHDFKQK